MSDEGTRTPQGDLEFESLRTGAAPSFKVMDLLAFDSRSTIQVRIAGGLAIVSFIVGRSWDFDSIYATSRGWVLS